MTSIAVSPAPAQAVRPATSMSSAFSSRRSITTPPSVEQWPAPLWPPLRTAISRPSSRAAAIAAATSVGVGDADDRGRMQVVTAHDDRAGAVVVGVFRADDAAADAVAQDGGDVGEGGVRAHGVPPRVGWVVVIGLCQW